MEFCGHKFVNYCSLSILTYEANLLFIYADLYYVAFPDDRWFFKSVVFLEVLLETVQTAAFVKNLLVYMTVGYFNLGILNTFGSTWYAIPLMTGLGMFYALEIKCLIDLVNQMYLYLLVASLTQGFYCHRIGKFSESKYVTVFIGLVRVFPLYTILYTVLMNIYDTPLYFTAIALPAFGFCRGGSTA